MRNSTAQGNAGFSGLYRRLLRLRQSRRLGLPTSPHQPSAHADRQGNHINGIENFWNQAKRHLRKYNGIPKHHFHLFLKECEWRFNYGSPAKLFSTLKTWIKLANR